MFACATANTQIALAKQGVQLTLNKVQSKSLPVRCKSSFQNPTSLRQHPMPIGRDGREVECAIRLCWRFMHQVVHGGAIGARNTQYTVNFYLILVQSNAISRKCTVITRQTRMTSSESSCESLLCQRRLAQTIKSNTAASRLFLIPQSSLLFSARLPFQPDGLTRTGLGK